MPNFPRGGASDESGLRGFGAGFSGQVKGRRAARRGDGGTDRVDRPRRPRRLGRRSRARPGRSLGVRAQPPGVECWSHTTGARPRGASRGLEGPDLGFRTRCVVLVFADADSRIRVPLERPHALGAGPLLTKVHNTLRNDRTSAGLPGQTPLGFQPHLVPVHPKANAGQEPIFPRSWAPSPTRRIGARRPGTGPRSPVTAASLGPLSRRGRLATGYISHTPPLVQAHSRSPSRQAG